MRRESVKTGFLGCPTFSSQEVFYWYNLTRKTISCYNNIYTQVINPLLKEGKIKKIAAGLFLVISNPNNIDTRKEETEKEKIFKDYMLKNISKRNKKNVEK